MKGNFRFLALIVMGLVMTNCADDELLGGDVKVGDEIVFGARASVEAGNENAQKTRTAFGDVSQDGTKIALNWLVNDQIDIACKQASGMKEATYKIPQEANAQSVSNTLVRVSPGVGLQWSGEGIHDFYGIYPSSQTFADQSKYPVSDLENPSFKINAGAGKAVGFMPMNYTAKNFDKQTVGNVRHYKVAPNMDYAFMVSKTSTTLAEVNKTQALQMSFEPLATILEFDITAGFIGAVNSDQAHEIQLDRIELVSTVNQNLTGNFEYDFNTQKLTNISETNRQNINLHLKYHGMQAENVILMKKDDVCTVDLFLMADQNIQSKSLKVKVWFTVDGAQRVKTATLGQEIQYKHKYVFKNFKLPTIATDMVGSTWFSGVENNVLMNQLSMICAGNAFSNNENMDWFTRQQVLDYKTLWEKGIRAFEFVTQSCPRSGQPDAAEPEWGLRDEHFVCGEIEMDGKAHKWCPGKNLSAVSVTFGEAFASLAKFLILDKYKDFHNETLVLIARYHAVCDGYSPQRYVKNLTDFLNYASTKGISDDEGNTFKVPTNRYVLLTSGSTAGDLKGKIAIIVRPGDDDYCRTNNVPVTGEVYIDPTWAGKLCYVENWGSAYDRWDTRYSNVAREATWNKSRKPQVEDNLWALSMSDTNFKPLNKQHDPNQDYNFHSNQLNEKFNFNCTINGKPNGGYIQEWARVVPEDMDLVKVSSVVNGADEGEALSFNKDNKKITLWYRWPTSYDQKLRAVKDVFQKSVERKGDVGNEPFCINVLSGYFVDSQKTNSCEPFQESMTVRLGNGAGTNHYELTFRPKNQGNGGNFAALASRLNVDVFNYLKGNELKQGPWGLVQMDYLGATDLDYLQNAGNRRDLHGGDAVSAAKATENMMQMFIINNFSFPLATKTVQTNANIPVDQSEFPVISE